MKHKRYIILFTLLLITLLCAVGSSAWIISKPTEEKTKYVSGEKDVVVTSEHIEILKDNSSDDCIEPIEMSVSGFNYVDSQLKSVIKIGFKITNLDECKKYAVNNRLKVDLSVALTQPESDKIFKNDSNYTLFVKSDSPIVYAIDDSDICDSAINASFILSFGEKTDAQNLEFELEFDFKNGDYDVFLEWISAFFSEENTIKPTTFTIKTNYIK